jgi:predicted nucleic acid-binding protein
VSRVVFLDSGPVWLLCRPPEEPETRAALAWLTALDDASVRVVLPEITDYEVRRELLRRRATRRLQNLDGLGLVTEYLPISTDAMRRAAELWATARQTGQPTAGDDTIDADMILIGQGQSLQLPDAIIATTNVRHLDRFFPADIWSNISAS